MKRNYKVPQIRYTNWSDKLKPGHEDYWEKCDTIARWIGYALEGALTTTSLGCISSTIGIAETKEKYGSIRVYCYLATHHKVEKIWKTQLSEIRKQNDMYEKWINGELDQDNHRDITPYMVGAKSKEFPLPEPDLDSLIEECIIEDTHCYRLVYMEAIKLFPEYEDAIRSGADHPEFLFEDVNELNMYFDEAIERISNNEYLSDASIDESIKKYEEERRKNTKLFFENSETTN